MEAKGENEIILGESSESVIVGRHEIAVIAAINGILGGLWEIHVPEKWTAHNLHGEIHTEHLGAEVKQTVSMAVDSQIHAHEQDVAEGVNTVFANGMAGILQDVHDLVERTDAFDQDSQLLLTNLGTYAERIDAIENRIRTVGVRIGTAGTQLRSSGESLETTGAKITNAGTDLSESAERIGNSATSINSAGVIMEGF